MSSPNIEQLQRENEILRGEVKMMQDAYNKIVEERNYWTHQTALRNQSMREMTKILGQWTDPK